MIKKKEKKKFIRQDQRLQNLLISDLYNFEADEIIEEKRATSKLDEKAASSRKSDLELKKARILEVKSNYNCLIECEGKILESVLSGRLKQLNLTTRNLVSAGDYVNVDFSDEPRIEEILPRRNNLSRFSEDNFQKEVIIASNIDQVIITSSVREPDLNLGLIDRYLCAAAIADITAVICLNKIDLEENIDPIKKQMDFYLNCGYRIVYTSCILDYGISELKDILKGKQSVFSGHSGVGKSTLINNLKPELRLKTAKVSEITDKGRHTTTSTKLIHWDFGGYLIDTPGIKTFGLYRQNKLEIYRCFPGFSALRTKCKFNNCSHEHEEDCAVKQAVENGEYPTSRYSSYIRIIDSL